MNREILFRAKAINREPDRYYKTNYKNGDWVYGFVSTMYDDMYDDSFSNLPAEMNNTDGVRGIDVDRRTIGEYTGLTDKNGTKIFEGDILHFGDKNYLVFWNDECFQWQMRIRKDGFSFPIYCGQDTGCPVECITLSWVAAEIPILGTMSTEIVGNIYDNPELIEE